MGLLLNPPVGGANRVSPRVTDWSLALAGAAAFTSGLLSLFSGRPDEWLVFAFHGAAGLWLLLMLWGKLRRVWPRLLRPRLWGRRTALGVPAMSAGALAGWAGAGWGAGRSPVPPRAHSASP